MVRGAGEPTDNDTQETSASAPLSLERRSEGCRVLMVLTLLAVGPPAFAFDVGSPDKLLSVEVHAFVSQGVILTTDNNYLAKSKDFSFEFTEGGINFTKALTDKLRAGIQLFGRKLGPVGDYSLKLDWFYLDYRLKDWIGIRAGRVKIPFGLYNDSSDIDSARAPVLLPQSVYPTLNRDFLLAQTGAEIYGYLNMRSAGALDYHVYAGTIFLDVPQVPGSPFQVVELTTRYVVGGRLVWETPLQGLRVAGSAQALRLDTKLLYPPNMYVTAKIPAVLAVGSIEYTGHNLLLAAEYSRWFVDTGNQQPDALSGGPHQG